MQQPEINYPCEWPYRVIGTDAAFLSEAIHTTLSPYHYTLSDGNVSKLGTYVSVHVEVHVADEGERNHVFSLLKKITNVRMVF